MKMANKEKFNIIKQFENIKPSIWQKLKSNIVIYTYYVLIAYIFICWVIYAFRYI